MEEIGLSGHQPFQLLTASTATEPDLSLLDLLEDPDQGKTILSLFVWFE